MEAEKNTPTTTKQEVKENELPKNSPYVATGTLEDYKMKGYGAEGHKEPKAGLGGGSTDAPTVSGDAAAAGTKGPTVLGDAAAAAAGAKGPTVLGDAAAAAASAGPKAP